MAQTSAERQRRYRERQKARAAASEAPQAAPVPPSADPAGGERPSLILQGLRLGIAHGDHVYCVDLLPGEALQLAMRLFAEIGISVQLTPVNDREAPRPMSASTPIAAIRPQGNA